MLTLSSGQRITREEARAQIDQLRELAKDARNNEEARLVISRIAQVVRKFRVSNGIGGARNPLEMAQSLDDSYQSRPHLELLSSTLLEAVQDVERGRNRQLITSMPPRAGKSTMTSQFSPLWLLQRHPEWKIVMTSYDGGLVASWARGIRHLIEDKPELGIALKRDGGAGGRWETVEGGGMYSVGVGGALTGRGAKVLIIDDPISDFVAAHSPRIRQNLWNWWLSVAQTRLEPPYLVAITMTRWHEDDLVGRLLSTEHEGDPAEWHELALPAVADSARDALRREEGQPLYSPLLVEDEEQALARWGKTKEAVGTYTWSAMYQQRPAPQAGAIFDMGWWRFWTRDPERATEDGRVIYLDPGGLTDARWVDSWDCTFKGAEGKGDYVVGQRWAMQGANRYLVGQQRDRWSFTQTIEAMKRWADLDGGSVMPGLVHERIIESAANGPAIIDVLRDKIAGIKPITARISKEARARAVTPEVESGNVYLPHPKDLGNEWVEDLLGELRNFPYDAHDDQVDALTQALNHLRGGGRGGITVPGQAQAMPLNGRRIPRDVARAAYSDFGRRRYS